MLIDATGMQPNPDVGNSLGWTIQFLQQLCYKETKMRKGRWEKHKLKET